MNILKVIATGAALVFATVSFAQDAEFSEIDVTLQLGINGKSNATDFWPMIESDMEAIMKQRISTIYNPNGLHVTVSLSEASQDGNRILSDEGRFNILRGLAFLRDQKDGPVVRVVELSWLAQPWQMGVQDGMFALPDRPDFYNAMLNKFADEMVNQIDS